MRDIMQEMLRTLRNSTYWFYTPSLQNGVISVRAKRHPFTYEIKDHVELFTVSAFRENSFINRSIIMKSNDSCDECISEILSGLAFYEDTYDGIPRKPKGVALSDKAVSGGVVVTDRTIGFIRDFLHEDLSEDVSLYHVGVVQEGCFRVYNLLGYTTIFASDGQIVYCRKDGKPQRLDSSYYNYRVITDTLMEVI